MEFSHPRKKRLRKDSNNREQLNSTLTGLKAKLINQTVNWSTSLLIKTSNWTQALGIPRFQIPIHTGPLLLLTLSARFSHSLITVCRCLMTKANQAGITESSSQPHRVVQECWNRIAVWVRTMLSWKLIRMLLLSN